MDQFRNEETRIEIGENVRGSEVFVVQSICKAPNGNGVNDALMELILMIDALRRASAGRITAVDPLLRLRQAGQEEQRPRADLGKGRRQPAASRGRRAHRDARPSRGSDSGLLRHSCRQSEARPMLCNYLKKEGLCDDAIVVVSPDAGGVHRAELFAKRLNSSLAIVFKRRPEPDVSEVTDIVGHVKGKIAVIVDDMISTGGTLAKAAEAILARGATKVYTVASHGIFAGEAIGVLERSDIERVIITNTIPWIASRTIPKFVQLSIAQTLADAINRITTNRSISELFIEGEPAVADALPAQVEPVPTASV